MNFIKKRDKIIEILELSGINEILKSKSNFPDTLPAAIVSLANRQGKNKIDFCFAEHYFKFDIYIVIDDDQTADEKIIKLIDNIDQNLQKHIFIAIENVELYHSMINAKNVKIAKFYL